MTGPALGSFTSPPGPLRWAKRAVPKPASSWCFLMEPPASSPGCREDPRRPTQGSLALSGPGAAGMAVTRRARRGLDPRLTLAPPGPGRGSGLEAAPFPFGRGSSPASPSFCPLAAGPFSSASPGSQDRAPMYLRHKTPAFKAQLGASVPRRRQRKGEIESPGGGPLAMRRPPFVCISGQVF